MTTNLPEFNLSDYFVGDERLKEIGGLPAVEFRENMLTYGDLRREVDYWAASMLEAGTGEGDRVALLLYDSPEFIACFLAAARIGAVCVPVNTFLSPDEISFILADSGASLLIVESELEQKTPPGAKRLAVDSVARPHLDTKRASRPRPCAATGRQSPAFLLYTSGSTGMPKGALHLHGAIPFTVESYARRVLRLTKDDRVYSASRLFFAYGLGNSLSFPLAASAAVLLDSERPAAERLARLFEERKPTVFFGVPAVYRSLLEHHRGGHGLKTASLRVCVSAGEALPAVIFEEWKREFGIEILDGIGSTEMLHIFISNREGGARPASSGTVVEGYEARLADDAGGEVEREQPGNLFIRGASATAGYWNRPDLTAQTIRDGWVRTGDIYRQDADGFFYHIGRTDDCFKVRGLWVSPVEVESALLSHEMVSEAAVVAATDGAGLATAKAFVVIRSEGSQALKDELRAHVGSRLPHFKVPSEIEFIAEMPRTSTGKIQRYRLRSAAVADRSGGTDDRQS